VRGVFAHADEIAKVVDAVVREGLDTIVTDAVDPDAAVFDVHFAGNFRQPIFIDGEVLGHAADRRDVMDLVDVHGQAACSEIAIACGDQFQGSISSMR
jgi:hypothetical protein